MVAMDNQLGRRLRENAKVLRETTAMLDRLAADGVQLSATARCLVDGFTIIEEQIQAAGCDLTQRQWANLPLACDGRNEAVPRAYELAEKLLVRCPTRLDEARLRKFVRARLSDAHLTLDELWAIPSMLRLALVEELRRAAQRAVVHHMDGASRRPAGDDLAVAPGRDRAKEEKTATQNRLKCLGALPLWDWKTFVEQHNLIDGILRQDPAGIYPRMDAASRDHYRRAVQKLARRSHHSEQEVAQAVMELAGGAEIIPSPRSLAPADREAVVRSHVGYYLVDGGRAALEERLGCQPGWREIVMRAAARRPLCCYVAVLFILWLAIISGSIVGGWALGASGTAGAVVCVLLGVLLAGLVGHCAIKLVNWLCTLVVAPRPTMRLDFSTGIPAEYRTMVVVPTMLTSKQGIHDLVHQLELRYLGNQDDNLGFALLTDLVDARQETLPGDQELVALARRQIRRLNRRYFRGRRGGFYLFHRPRRWNPAQGVWMGEERKRGKLTALNQWLLFGDEDAFAVIEGDRPGLASVRYVITLDTDTGLPPDVAHKLVGAMAHPLNQPRHDAGTGRVSEGYAIMQPRLGVMIADAQRSPYSRLLAGEAGIDPYTGHASNLYHDLFAEASYIGRVPEDCRRYLSSARQAGRRPRGPGRGGCC